MTELITNHEPQQAIPYITDEFHSLLDIGWYGSAYTLATYVSPLPCRSRLIVPLMHRQLISVDSAILQPMTGKFYFRFGNKVNLSLNPLPHTRHKTD